jgi:2-oxoglutarate ferredoxin oxidoreductase subunit beta
LSDFSFNVSALIGALIRVEKFTVILCNMPFYGPKDGRPAPANEPKDGRLEPVTRINTSEGQKLIVGGHPLHVAELVATFEGVVYSARGTITSMKDYQLTKRYVRTALQKQLDNAGFSFVEVLCTCCDSTYAAPADSLKWIKDKMSVEFPLGEFKGNGR